MIQTRQKDCGEWRFIAPPYARSCFHMTPFCHAPRMLTPLEKAAQRRGNEIVSRTTHCSLSQLLQHSPFISLRLYRLELVTPIQPLGRAHVRRVAPIRQEPQLFVA